MAQRDNEKAERRMITKTTGQDKLYTKRERRDH